MQPGARLETRRWTDRQNLLSMWCGNPKSHWTTADMKELSVTLLPRNKFPDTHSQLSQLTGGVVLDGHCSHCWLALNHQPFHIGTLGDQSECVNLQAFNIKTLKPYNISTIIRVFVDAKFMYLCMIMVKVFITIKYF